MMKTFQAITATVGTMSPSIRSKFLFFIHNCNYSVASSVHPHRNCANTTKSRRLNPVPIQFNEALAALARMKRYSVAICLMKRLELRRPRNFKPDFYTFNIAINCFCNLNRVDFGLSVLGKVIKLGYEPNYVTFTTLIEGLCLKVKSKAVKFFDKAEQKGFKSHLITYEPIRDALYELENKPSAFLLLKDFEKVERCQPRIVEYNTIIDSLCEDKKVSEALIIISVMIRKGIMPNVVTYNSLIRGLCSDGKADRAVRFLDQAVQKGLQTNFNTYRTIINKLLNIGESSAALLLLKDMKLAGCCDIVLYDKAIGCLAGKRQEI